MGFRINTNLLSLKAQQNLQKTGKSLDKSLTRLSTGLRINAAKDDVAGIVQAATTDAQKNGTKQAISNLSNAFNTLSVAEGSVNQQIDVVQQLRTLAIQASSTLSNSERSNVSSQAQALLEEFDRLNSTAKFNGQRLLDGTYAATYQVGSNSDETISISLESTDSQVLGWRHAKATIDTDAVSGDLTSTHLEFSSDLYVAGSYLDAKASDDTLSRIDNSASALAYVAAINRLTSTTGVTASLVETEITLTASGASLVSGDSLVLNGVTLFSATSVTASDGSVLANKINSATTFTALWNSTEGTVTITSSDGRNIDFQLINGNNSLTSYASTTTVLGISFGVTVDSDTDGIYIKRGAFVFEADHAFNVMGAQEWGADSEGIATIEYEIEEAAHSLSYLNMDSAENAQLAINILDGALESLGSSLASIGSVTARFDNVEADLRNKLENYTASLSRIRDADVAEETANLTASQILQQAGAQVLARANSIPQLALSLLQG